MPDLDLCYLSTEEISRQIKAKNLSPVEVTRAVLNRAREIQLATNAFITLAEDEAMAGARAAEAELAAGRWRGPLHGVPVSVKDIIDVQGLLTTCGSKALHDNVAVEDAYVVQRLREAGAVIIGKTNMSEFAERFMSPVYGPVLNPWDTRRSGGLSSGGAAVAVASGASFTALGTDTGGSVRVPAAFCGCVGLKTTHGRVSARGVFPLCWAMDTVGPLARTARDAALALQAIAGYDPADPASKPEPVPDYVSGLSEDLKGVRVGMPVNYFFDSTVEEVKDLAMKAVGVLEDLGAEVRDVRFSQFGPSWRAWAAVAAGGEALAHRELLQRRGDLYGPELGRWFQAAMRRSAEEYAWGQRTSAALAQELRLVFEQVDVFVTPTMPDVAFAEGPGMPGYREDPERPTGAADGASLTAHDIANTLAPFNLTGAPAISVPCGFTAAGLPAGLQIVGPHFSEGRLLRVAHAYQSATDYHGRRPPL